MSSSEIWIRNLVAVTAGVMRGDAFAMRLFEQPEFKAAVFAREAALLQPDRPMAPMKNAEPDPSFLPHWIEGPGKQAGVTAIDRIRGFLRGAERVTWCDPYLLDGTLSETFDDSEHYAEVVASVLPISARNLRLYVPQRPKAPKPGVDPKQPTVVWRRLKEGRNVQVIETREIHDRYVLRDGSAGLLIGSSFGGLGGKYCTILQLPDEDVATLYSILDEIARP